MPDGRADDLRRTERARGGGDRGALVGAGAHEPGVPPHRVVSTFSGIGGIDLGLERAGWTVVAQAEKDAYRRAVLAERFPGVECAEDVRGVGLVRRDDGRAAAGRNGDAPHRDDRGGTDAPLGLLCGGFPCQDLSVAGRRAGLAGARSGLFFAFADVAESLRPRWILLENVPGLLSSCSCQGCRKCGVLLRWHRRRKCGGCAGCRSALALRRAHAGTDFAVVRAVLNGIGYGVAWRILDSRFFGVPQRRRRVFIVGCDLGGRAGAERAGAILAVGSGCGGHPAPGEQEGPGSPIPAVAGTLGSGELRRGRSTDLDGHGAYIVSAPVTSKWAKGNGGPAGDEAQNLVVASADDDRDDVRGGLGGLQTDGLGERLGTVGVRGDLSTIDADHELGHFDLQFGDVDSLCIPGTSRQPSPGQDSSVRRLTPRECERLQGFPDDWTRITWRGKPAADSLRYAACGDAVTVPVAEWLGRRLLTSGATP